MTSLLRPIPEPHRMDEVVLAPHCAFHSDTIPLSDIRQIGIAANDTTGDNVVKVLDMESL